MNSKGEGRVGGRGRRRKKSPRRASPVDTDEKQYAARSCCYPTEQHDFTPNLWILLAGFVKNSARLASTVPNPLKIRFWLLGREADVAVRPSPPWTFSRRRSRNKHRACSNDDRATTIDRFLWSESELTSLCPGISFSRVYSVIVSACVISFTLPAIIVSPVVAEFSQIL